MDSMRSLNSSLPRPSATARRRQANGELLRAFKAAALSVTQLYKTAAAEDETPSEAHNAGYVDALDDLLAFLDERNLGLGDGEGWQVREWATRRHQSMTNSQRTSEEHDIPSAENDEPRGRSTSPALQVKAAPQYQTASVQTEPTTIEPEDPPLQPHGEPTTVDAQRPETFDFRSSMSMPSQQDVEMNTQAQRSPPSVRVDILPRTTRNTSHRAGHHSRHASERPQTVSLGSLGHGAGSKRKIPLHEFFDINGSGGGREGHGPGKKGRLG